MTIRSYSELLKYHTFEERYRYLRLRASVGSETFGYERYLNQRFYTSMQWKHARDKVIARDEGCDLGVDGFQIHSRIYIHHMNPMSPEDLLGDNPSILDPEFLICVTHSTHNAIHYGDESLLPTRLVVERRPGDTKLW